MDYSDEEAVPFQSFLPANEDVKALFQSMMLVLQSPQSFTYQEQNQNFF